MRSIEVAEKADYCANSAKLILLSEKSSLSTLLPLCLRKFEGFLLDTNFLKTNFSRNEQFLLTRVLNTGRVQLFQLNTSI